MTPGHFLAGTKLRNLYSPKDNPGESGMSCIRFKIIVNFNMQCISVIGFLTFKLSKMLSVLQFQVIDSSDVVIQVVSFSETFRLFSYFLKN